MMSKTKIAVLISYLGIASVSAVVITPSFAKIQLSFDLGHGSVQWVITIFLIAYVFGQLIYGPLSNSFGCLNSLRAALFVNLLGVILCFISVDIESYALLLFGRFITALGSAAGMPCAFILINGLLPERQAKVVTSYASLSFALAVAIGILVGGLITHYLHWQDCFIFLLAYGVLMLILTYLYQEPIKEKKAFKPIVTVKGYFQVCHNSQLIVFSLFLSFVSMFTYCYVAQAPLYAVKTLQMSTESYGYWNLVTTLGSVGSSLLGAKIIEQLGAKKLLFIGSFCILPCFLSLGLVSISHDPHPIWFFSTAMFLYLFSGFLFPAASFYALKTVTDKASASSVLLFIYMGSAMLSVVIMGYLPYPNIQALALTLTSFFAIVACTLFVYCFLNPGALQE